MRCYTLAASGIRCRSGQIEVGDEGRGRKLVRVPLPPQSVMQSDVDPYSSFDALVECAGPATSALVLIPDQSGFRGGWRLRDARTPEEWDAVLAVPIPDGIHPESIAAGDIRREFARQFERAPTCRIIGEGFAAQGDAGRMGGGPEYLIHLDHGQAVELVRSGRLYGRPSVVRLECQAGLIVESDPRAEAESRIAAAKWNAASRGGEATEIVLRWGGGFRRDRTHNWSVRPHLVDAAGQVHVFDGQPIPDIVDVLANESVTSGYQNGRCDAYRVVLFPGVSLRGYEVPQSEPIQPVPETPIVGTLGMALQSAAVAAQD